MTATANEAAGTCLNGRGSNGAQLRGPELNLMLDDSDAQTPEKLCAEFASRAVNLVKGEAKS